MEYTRSEAKPWANQHIKNFYMCPLTPLNKDYTLDEAGIRSNIDQYIDMGIEGLVVGGFIAECWNLPVDEWLRYHEIVADAVAGRTDLWSIILDPSVHQGLQKMHAIEKMGYNGVEVMNPSVQLKTDDEIFAFFKYMTDHSNMAICLYRTPVSGTVLSHDLMRRLGDIDTMVAVKQGLMNRMETLKLRSIMRPDFIVSEPVEYWFLHDLRNGGQVVWGELSYILYGKKRPLVRDYIALARAGKWEEAHAAWEKLAAVRDLYAEKFLWHAARTATYSGALANMKVWFEAIGLKAGPIMPPVAPINPATREELIGLIKATGAA